MNFKPIRLAPQTKGDYTLEQLQNALEAVRTKKMGYTMAARVYKIPSATLYQKANNYNIDTKSMYDISEIF